MGTTDLFIADLDESGMIKYTRCKVCNKICEKPHMQCGSKRGKYRK